MRRLFAIGIGAGDSEQLTVEAVRALNGLDVVFVVDKGEEVAELAALREQICDRYVEGEHRTVFIPDPKRDRTAAAYREAVEDWRRARAAAWGEAITAELEVGETGAFLVWGDPALYDSTLAVLERIAAAAEPALEYTSIPGISSVQSLAARHKISLTRVGASVLVTTGRRLAAEGLPGDADVVVMLDAGCAFSQLVDDDLDIYWGAYLGTADEILIAGPLAEVATRIESVRAEARERKGWIMDTYLLRRR
ncbi:MAG TPA: precorrin-6A synthase (deacetylating) [Solirubrobacterales bacterium]|nr:precorrin-6A synthase (deacetylating) [Solirubrobacterales bacterium]